MVAKLPETLLNESIRPPVVAQLSSADEIRQQVPQKDALRCGTGYYAPLAVVITVFVAAAVAAVADRAGNSRGSNGPNGLMVSEQVALSVLPERC